MKKRILGKLNILAAVLLGVAFASCQKEDLTKERYENKPQSPVVIIETDTVYQIGSKTYVVSRSEYFGTVTAHNSETGENFNEQYPLGGINFWITPHDTIEGDPVVYHNLFNAATPIVTTIGDTLGCNLTRTTINFTDRYDQYQLDGRIWWLDGYVVVWGDTLYFPLANGGVNFQSYSTAESGSDANWNYTLSTSVYAVSSLWGVSNRYGYKTLKREKGNDELISVEKTGEGFVILTSNAYGPTSGRSWIELTYTYSVSGPTTTTVEQILTMGAEPDADTSVYSTSFNLSWRQLGMGGVQTTGTTTNGNVTVLTKEQWITDGAQNLYVRRNHFHWQKATWSDGTHTFAMPSPEYQGHNVNNTLTDLSPITGYDRKMATNKITATFHGAAVNVPCHTTILVEAETPPVTPTIDHYELVDTGVTYVSSTVNNYWAKFRPVMTDGTYGTVFTKDKNCTNGMQTPAIGPEIAVAWSDVYPVNITSGSEQYQSGSDFHDGDWTVKTYTKKCTVNCALFNLVWTGTVQKPTLDFGGHHIVFNRSYSYAMSSGDYENGDMGTVTSGNVTYVRKMWKQWITASFNNHTNQYSGTCEVRVPDYIPDETPDWWGGPNDARYTRVQPYANAGFIDMIAFKFDNIVVLAPNGVVDFNLVYALTPAVAAAHNIPLIGNANAWYSAEWHDGKWWPAKITPTGDYVAWTYVAGPTQSEQHSVDRNDALALGIGYNYHPIPSSQTVTINGDVITITYSANNAGTTQTASCQLH